MPAQTHLAIRQAIPGLQPKERRTTNSDPQVWRGASVSPLNFTQDAGNLHEDEAAALSKAPPQGDPLNDERMRFVDFVMNEAAERYRFLLGELYLAWQGFNERFFKERLQPPHLTIASGPPRALGIFKSFTDYGGRTQITIDARVVLARRGF